MAGTKAQLFCALVPLHMLAVQTACAGYDDFDFLIDSLEPHYSFY